LAKLVCRCHDSFWNGKADRPIGRWMGLLGPRVIAVLDRGNGTKRKEGQYS
jgi:hypothetical protein